MPAPSPDITLGIAISGATLAPGKTRTLAEIAAFCGCTKECIRLIERSALRKLRNRILFDPARRDLFAELLSRAPSPSASSGERNTNPPIL